MLQAAGRPLGAGLLTSIQKREERERAAKYKSVVLSDGRGQAATPQGLIVVTAKVPKNERERRLNSMGPDDELLAPISENDKDYSMEKGMLVALYKDDETTGRKTVAEYSPIIASASLNGMTEEEFERRFIGLAVNQLQRSTGDDGLNEDLVTAVLKGVQTIINSGLQTVEIGATVRADYRPAQVRDEFGHVVPGVQERGVSKSMYRLQTVGYNMNQILSQERVMKDHLRVRLGEPQFFADVKKDDRLSELLLEAVTEECNNQNLSMSHPMRPRMHLWVAHFLRKMLLIDAIQPAETAWKSNRVHFMAMARRHHDRMLQLCFRVHRRRADAYAKQLPHHFERDDEISRSLMESSRDSVYSTELTDWCSMAKFQTVMASGNADKKKEWVARVAAADAMLDLAHEHMMEVFIVLCKDYLRKLHVGVALSSAAPGQPFDVNFGAV